MNLNAYDLPSGYLQNYRPTIYKYYAVTYSSSVLYTVHAVCMYDYLQNCGRFHENTREKKTA